ncbi:MAG: hypothetical protein KAI66_23115, partial [Lentisphaeria bacterium]|nr:hypothetical protein [Lentisphaeria bacterium]
MLPDSLPAKLPQHILASLCFALGLQAGQPVLHTAKWANNNTAFAEFAARIEENHPRNLLARKGVRSSGAEAALTDGQAGARGGAGRVNISGQPTTLTYYLGAVKPIHRVGFYTFNIDARANQDYEVRFATNTGHPGEQPTFGKKADLTSGAAVIGPNKGGFHSWFEQKDGTPITRADWVQFRIWRTYNVKVGHPAHSTQTSSWTAAIELEIHGAKDDVVHIDPAILARRKALREALRLLPPSPEFRKNKDWWHSMVASREAILQWETKTDRLLVEISGARFGPWFVLGPVKNKGQEDQQLTRAGTVNLGKPLSGGLRWRPAPEIRDGDTLDLAKVYKLKPGQTLFLARTAEFQRAFDRRRPYAIGLGLGDGEARIPPTRARERCAGLAGPNQRTLRVTCNPGDYHVLLRAPVRADGTCPFWFMPQPSTGRRNAGNEAARRGRRMRLFQTLRNEFPDALSQQQMDWEQWDSIWIQFKRLSMARRSYMLSDWTPGQEPVLLVKQYA